MFLMKTLLLALALLTYSDLAAAQADIVNLGAGVECRQSGDVGMVAYLPSNLSFQVSGDNSVTLSLQLEHIRCEGANAPSWAPYPAMGPIAGVDGQGRPITIQRSESEAVLKGATNSTLRGLVSLGNTSSQDLSFSFLPSQALTQEELAALDAGKVVMTRAEFFVRSVYSVITADNETVIIGLRAGGAYTIFLTWEKSVDGRVQVKKVSL
jgi:hypothetical protein